MQLQITSQEFAGVVVELEPNTHTTRSIGGGVGGDGATFGTALGGVAVLPVIVLHQPIALDALDQLLNTIALARRGIKQLGLDKRRLSPAIFEQVAHRDTLDNLLRSSEDFATRIGNARGRRGKQVQLVPPSLVLSIDKVTGAVAILGMQVAIAQAQNGANLTVQHGVVEANLGNTRIGLQETAAIVAILVVWVGCIAIIDVDNRSAKRTKWTIVGRDRLAGKDGDAQGLDHPILHTGLAQHAITLDTEVLNIEHRKLARNGHIGADIAIFHRLAEEATKHGIIRNITLVTAIVNVGADQHACGASKAHAQCNKTNKIENASRTHDEQYE